MQWFFIPRGGFLHFAYAAVGMTMMLRFYGFAYCFRNISGRPASLISQGYALPASPEGKLLFRALRERVYRAWFRPFGCGTAHRPFRGVAITTSVGTKRNHPPTCHSERVNGVEESSRVAGFCLWWFYVPRGGFLHSACAAVGMTQWGDVSGFYR